MGAFFAMFGRFSILLHAVAFLAAASPALASGEDIFDCTTLAEEHRAECRESVAAILEDRATLAGLRSNLSMLLDALVATSDALARSSVPETHGLTDRHDALRARLPEARALDPDTAADLETADALADLFADVVVVMERDTGARDTESIARTRRLVELYREAVDVFRDARALFAEFEAETLRKLGLLRDAAEIQQEIDLHNRAIDAFSEAARLEDELALVETAKEAYRLLDSGHTRLARNLFEKTCEIDIGCDELLDLFLAHDRIAAFKALAEKLRMRCAGPEAAPETCGALGKHLLDGSGGIPPDRATALSLMDGACRKDHQISCVRAGSLLYDAPTNAADLARARAHFGRACRLPGLYRPVGCSDFARMLMDGEGGPADPVGARRHLETACAPPAPLAWSGCDLLGDALRDGVGGPVDKAAAYAAYAHGCAQQVNLSWVGHACLGAGRMDAFGDGRPVDWAAARPSLRRACDLGNPEACGLIGYALAFAKGGPAEATPGYEAAVKGCGGRDAYACFLTGHLVELRSNSPPNIRAARDAYEIACDQDHMEGCAAFARLTLKRTWLPPDLARRVLGISQEACSAEIASACNTVGLIYTRGYGIVRPSSEVALGYFRGGCRLGSDTACKNVEILE